MMIKNQALNLLAAISLTAVAATAQDITVVADFEEAREFNNITGFWYYTDDAGNGGDSKITSGDTTFKPTQWNAQSFLAPGQGDSKYAAKLGFTFGTKDLSCGPTCTYKPEVLLGTDVRKVGDSTLDLTGATKFTFWAKADVAMSINVIWVTADITDYSYFRKPVQIKTEWTEHTILLSPSTALSGPGWGQSMNIKFNAAQTKAINFTVSKGLNGSVTSSALYLDNLRFHNWKPVTDPNAVRAPSRSAISRALRATADGKSLRFRLPDAYRSVEGTVAAMDLSGRVLAEAGFAKGQENVTLRLAARPSAAVFFRVFTGSESR